MSERSSSPEVVAEFALPDWLDEAAAVVSDATPLPHWLDDGAHADDALLSLPRPRVVAGAERSTPAAVRPATERRPVFRAAHASRRRSEDRADAAPSQRRRRRLRWSWRFTIERNTLAKAAVGGTVAAVLLAAGVVAPLLVEKAPNAETARAYWAVERLRAGAPVLVVLDYPPERSNDFAAAEALVLRHAAAQGARVIAASPQPELGDRLRSLVPNGAITHLPPLATDPDAIRRLGQRESVTGVPTDPALRRATGDRPLELMVVVGDPHGTARWLSNVKTGAKPAAIAVVAGETTLLNPLRATGQVTGIVRADRDVLGYAALVGAGAPPSRVGAMATGPSVVASVVLALACLARLVRVGRRGLSLKG